MGVSLEVEGNFETLEIGGESRNTRRLLTASRDLTRIGKHLLVYLPCFQQ